MGGASSALAFNTEKVLSADQYKTLTPSTRKRFQAEAENKIAERKMNDVELHMHLTLEYERLITELQEREYGSLTEGTLASTGGLQTKGAWNGDKNAKEKIEKRRLIHSLYKTDYMKELDSIRSTAADPDESVEPERPGQGHDSWTISRSTDDHLVKRPPRCHLCSKDFSYEWQFNQHVKHSKLHALAVEEKEQQFALALKKAAKLSAIVKSGIACFASPGARTRLSEEVANVPRARWRAAIGKTIQRQTFERYQAFLKDMHVKTGAAENNTVLCLYSGSKFFWKHGETVGVHLYLHAKFNCVEVVCQFHDARFENVTASLTAAPSAAPSADPSAPCPGLRESRIARVYLCHSVLLAQTTARRKTRVDWEEWVQSSKGRFERNRLGDEAEERVGREVLVDAVLEGLQLDPRNPSGALVYAWAADDSGDGGEGAEVEEGQCCSRKLSAQPASQSGRERERERGQASGKGRSAAETMDPNLGGKPAGLNAAAIDVVQLNQLWQIEQAMAHVDHSTRELGASVRRCERIADVLESTISMFVYRSKVAHEKAAHAQELSGTQRKFNQVLKRVVRMQAVQKTAARLEGLAIKAASPAATPLPSPSALLRRSFSHRNQQAEFREQGQERLGSPGRSLSGMGGLGATVDTREEADSPRRNPAGSDSGKEERARGRLGKPQPGSPGSQRLRVGGDDDDDGQEEALWGVSV